MAEITEETGTITVPKALIARIEEYIADSEFESADEYAAFVLEEVMNELEEDEEGEEQVFSEEDEEKVKERLRALGYLD